MSQVPEIPDSEDSLVETFRGRRDSPEELFGLIYQELRLVAPANMWRERADLTLRAIALVNEAYLRLFDGQPFQWENRKHLFVPLQEAWARADGSCTEKGAERDRGALRRIELGERCSAIFRDLPEFLALDEALDRLTLLNPSQAQMVELHSFFGLSAAETPEVLDVSVKTVKNDWCFVKAWLKTEIGGPGG